jgi:outer membrane protein OmpA-like peptidoglycan-associated protein
MSANREWLSISDMMSGLMMVFLFIAVAFMLDADKDKKQVTNIAKTYSETTLALNKALRDEFSVEELRAWGAEILDDNTIRFKEPKTLFNRASAKLKEKFKVVLDNFFVRYVKVLTNPRFKADILELRIEGHTSPVGRYADDSSQDAYLYNAELSQKRALSVLMHVFKVRQVRGSQMWLEGVLRANGLSYSRQLETFEQSRRVEFRVIVNTEDKIKQILRLEE